MNLHSVGVAQIKDILSRLPKGESVFWGGGHFVIQTNTGILFELPLSDIIEELKEHAKKLGLNFTAH